MPSNIFCSKFYLFTFQDKHLLSSLLKLLNSGGSMRNRRPTRKKKPMIVEASSSQDENNNNNKHTTHSDFTTSHEADDLTLGSYDMMAE